MKKNKESEIILNIYRKMFKESTPSADFDKMMKSGETKENNFFMKYYLKDREQDKIIYEELSKHKRMPKWKKDRIARSIFLGCSPCSNIDSWVKD